MQIISLATKTLPATSGVRKGPIAVLDDTGNFSADQAARRRGGLDLNIEGTFDSGCRNGTLKRSRSLPFSAAVRTCMSMCAP
jgi:hypothetical protein